MGRAVARPEAGSGSRVIRSAATLHVALGLGFGIGAVIALDHRRREGELSPTPGGRSPPPASGPRCSREPGRTGRSSSWATSAGSPGTCARRSTHVTISTPGARVILFADERVLSSDEDEWERWAREAVEAEAYSRRLAKRIREGYAAKRRRLGVPGGNRAPFGTVRDGRTITIDEASFAVIRRVYELASAGLTDREVGAATGLALKHVAEILTNPFYIGVS